MNEQEVWKQIPGYEGIYQASTDGRIKSVERKIQRCDGVEQVLKERILSPALNASGYYNVCLRKNGKAKSYLVSRLIAMTFISNPCSLPEVNHKNEIKTDNRVENLEWIGRKENCNFGTRNKRHSEYMKGKFKGNAHSHPRPVCCVTTGERFSCIREAAEHYRHKSQSSISACCRGKNRTAGKLPDGRRLEWKYDDS